MTVFFWFCSNISERSFQQEPVIQHAGFPSEINSGESENTPVCQGQFSLSAITWVSWFYFVLVFICGYVVFTSDAHLLSSCQVMLQLH